MGGGEEPVAIRSPDGSVIRLAQLGRTLADGIEDGSKVGPRACDDAKDLAGRPLLILRFMHCAGEPRDLGFLAGSGGTVAAHSLLGFRLAASPCSHFAACSGAPSHRLPQGSGQGIVAGRPVLRYGMFAAMAPVLHWLIG